MDISKGSTMTRVLHGPSSRRFTPQFKKDAVALLRDGHSATVLSLIATNPSTLPQRKKDSCSLRSEKRIRGARWKAPSFCERHWIRDTETAEARCGSRGPHERILSAERPAARRRTASKHSPSGMRDGRTSLSGHEPPPSVTGAGAEIRRASSSSGCGASVSDERPPRGGAAPR